MADLIPGIPSLDSLVTDQISSSQDAAQTYTKAADTMQTAEVDYIKELEARTEALGTLSKQSLQQLSTIDSALKDAHSTRVEATSRRSELLGQPAFVTNLRVLLGDSQYSVQKAESEIAQATQKVQELTSTRDTVIQNSQIARNMIQDQTVLDTAKLDQVKTVLGMQIQAADAKSLNAYRNITSVMNVLGEQRAQGQYKYQEMANAASTVPDDVIRNIPEGATEIKYGGVTIPVSFLQAEDRQRRTAEGNAAIIENNSRMAAEINRIYKENPDLLRKTAEATITSEALKAQKGALDMSESIRNINTTLALGSIFTESQLDEIEKNGGKFQVGDAVVQLTTEDLNAKRKAIVESTQLKSAAWQRNTMNADDVVHTLTKAGDVLNLMQLVPGNESMRADMEFTTKKLDTILRDPNVSPEVARQAIVDSNAKFDKMREAVVAEHDKLYDNKQLAAAIRNGYMPYETAIANVDKVSLEALPPSSMLGQVHAEVFPKLIKRLGEEAGVTLTEKDAAAGDPQANFQKMLGQVMASRSGLGKGSENTRADILNRLFREEAPKLVRDALGNQVQDKLWKSLYDSYGSFDLSRVPEDVRKTFAQNADGSTKFNVFELAGLTKSAMFAGGTFHSNAVITALQNYQLPDGTSGLEFVREQLQNPALRADLAKSLNTDLTGAADPSNPLRGNLTREPGYLAAKTLYLGTDNANATLGVVDSTLDMVNSNLPQPRARAEAMAKKLANDEVTLRKIESQYSGDNIVDVLSLMFSQGGPLGTFGDQ